MFAFVSVPTSLTANIGTQVTDLVGGLAPYIVYLVGIFLGLFILEWIVGVIQDSRRHAEITHHLASLDPLARGEALASLRSAEEALETRAIVSEGLEDYQSHF